MYRKRSFREKLADDKDLPRAEKLKGGMKKRFGSGTIVLPAVSQVADLMRKVPRGMVTTVSRLREILAEKHDANMACPMVTGIHARIVAGAAGEDEAEGRKRVAPYWRTLKANGELNARYPGGPDGQKRRLESEGHTIIMRGKRCFVDDYKRVQAKPA